MVQLGTRWTIGATPPRGLVTEVVNAIERVEVDIAALSVDSSSWRWTLTWLEGRPICELDDGTRVILEPDGTVSVNEPD